MSKKKISLLLPVLVFAGALMFVPVLAHATQIAPNPNVYGISVSTQDAENYDHPFSNEAMLIIDSAGILTNYGELINYSGGTLTNRGTLYNSYSGTLTNYDRLENYGVLTNGTGLYNYGVLSNYSGGTLTNVGLGTLYNYGELINYSGGTLHNYHDGTLYNSYGGMLTNCGTLTNSWYLTNAGTLNNAGVLDNYPGSVLNNRPGGTLNNHPGGTLNNGGELNNSGTLNNAGTLYNYAGLGTIYGTGTYTQSAGRTINDGSMSQTSFTFNGGILSGTGTMNGLVIIGSGASVQPGNSVGTLTINGDFFSSGNLVFEIGGATAGLYDVLNISGNATFTGGNILFEFINGYTPTVGTYWDFLLPSSIIGWDTVDFCFVGLGPGWEFDATSTGGRLVTASAAVPEPSTMLLLGTGLVGLVGFRRKFRR